MSARVIKSLLIVATVCVIGGIGGYFLLSFLPPKPDWVYGHWWYDAPENVAQDSLWFKPNGKVEFLSDEEKVVRRCRYTTLIENQVNIQCKDKIKPRNIVLRFRNTNGVRDLSDKTGKIYFKQ